MTTPPIRSFRRVAQLCFITTSFIALVLCPHSKVEESFQLQATHDLFYYGVGPMIRSFVVSNAMMHSNATASTVDLPYDHLQYPGVVPRTFLGPFLLAYSLKAIQACLILLVRFDLGDYPMLVQFLARFLLWLVHVQAWFQFASAIDDHVVAKQRTSPSPSSSSLSTSSSQRDHRHQHIASYLLLITASQFHVPFYASRMLPNTFALILVLYCYTAWLRHNTPRAAVWLVFATAIVRCDLLLLLFTVGLSWLVTRQLTMVHALRLGVMTGVASLLLTTPLDSLLWKQGRQWVWPEGQVFWFNTVLGKSKEWGVLPWHWYLSSAIPKAMLATLFLMPLTVVHLQRPRLPPSASLATSILRYVDTTWLPYLIPIGAFIGLYSCLGHKEMRFIFPAIPMLNLAAAVGMNKLHGVAWCSTKNDDDDEAYAASKKSDRPVQPKLTGSMQWVVRLALWTCGIAAILVTLLGSATFLAVSTWNYPGGMALSRLIRYIGSQKTAATGVVVVVKVHVDVASAMSGVSLFGQREATMNGKRRGRDDRWIFDKGGYEEEHAQQRDFSQFTHLLSEEPIIPGFHIVQAVQGKPRLDIRHLRIATEDAIYILERNNWK